MNASAVACRPLYLVLGDEELLVQRAVQAVVDTARRADPGTEVRRLRATDLAPGELAELVSPSLFADGRVIVLEAAHEAGKDVAEAVLGYVRAPADGIVLVAEHAGGNRGKALAEDLRAAGAVVTECPRITRSEDRAAFVREEVRRAGSRISADAVPALLDAVGSDLRELAAAGGRRSLASPLPRRPSAAIGPGRWRRCAGRRRSAWHRSWWPTRWRTRYAPSRGSAPPGEVIPTGWRASSGCRRGR